MVAGINYINIEEERQPQLQVQLQLAASTGPN